MSHISATLGCPQLLSAIAVGNENSTHDRVGDTLGYMFLGRVPSHVEAVNRCRRDLSGFEDDAEDLSSIGMEKDLLASEESLPMGTIIVIIMSAIILLLLLRVLAKAGRDTNILLAHQTENV